MAAKAASYVVWPLLVFIFAVAALLVAFETAMHFGGSAIDGPFQLYNALRRIQAGFRPGIDFQYFHGLGIPYSHYWLYRLLGGGLRGSELARELVTTTAYPIVYLVFFRVFAGDWRRAWCLTAAALAASFLLKMSAVIFALNGMLGLRAALPTVLPVAAFLCRTRRTRTAAVGLLLGLSLFLSTEQGLAAILAYILVSALAVVRRAERGGQAAEAVGTLGVAVVTLLACLLLIGGPAGMHGALRYNFRIVPMDQYWYFGAPPNVFVPSWDVVIPMLSAAPVIGAALFFAIGATVLYVHRLWRTPDGDAGQRAFALAILPVYGLISCASLLGVFTPAYVQPCWRVLLLVGFLEATTAAERYDVRHGHRGWLGVPRAIAVGALAVCGLTIADIRLIPTAFRTVLPHLFADHISGDARFGIDGIWPETLRDAQAAIDSHRGPRGELPSLWSTYAGWVEARNGMFHPSVDYIIHALGPENRQKYVDDFVRLRPQLVQTVLPTYTQYEGWIENNDWAFYDHLLDWYTVAATTPWSLFWERRPTPAPPPQVIGTMTVPAGMTAVTLPPIPDSLQSPLMLLEVDVEYDTHNPLRWLPIIGASPGSSSASTVR